MRVTILHQDVPLGAAPDEQDVLVQRDAVAESLGRLGHSVDALACTLDLAELQSRLRELAPDVVFNLVESLSGTDSLQSLVPSLLESMNVPFTGSSSVAIQVSGRKTLAKEMLRSRGLPTPAWWAAGANLNDVFEPGRYIVKPLAEHASLGMTDADVIFAETVDALRDLIAQKTGSLGRPCFAEQYIDGREFNISLLAGPTGPEMLPPAEIRFEGYPEDKPRIVGRDAKWSETSFEYKATVRSFEMTEPDAAIRQQLETLSLQCWQVLGLSGFARVDFRVDPQGRPWILEANANPCLSPDAGFAAAAGQAGLGFDDVVSRILSAARPA